jgi:nucleoredoxin
MAKDWVEYFGPTLQTKEGLGATNEVLKGKTRIGIYLAGHWCPPCRGFTPVLTKFYESVFKENSNDLAIVFVSEDSDDESYDKHYGTMPWYAVPYSERDIVAALRVKFDVRGIPVFIVLESHDGHVLDPNGRATVTAAKGDVSNALGFWH